MSAAPRIPDDFGLAGLRMSAADYLALGETRERYELVDGVLIMSPRPNPTHQTVLRLIQRQLESHLDANPTAAYFPEIDLELGPQRVYSPDLSCWRAGRLTGIPRSPVRIPPDLIIEILSPGTRAFDLTTKRDDYETFGVGEYWAYDPADGRLRAYVRRDALFLETSVAGESFAATALPGFVLDLRPLRAILRVM